MVAFVVMLSSLLSKRMLLELAALRTSQGPKMEDFEADISSASCTLELLLIRCYT